MTPQLPPPLPPNFLPRHSRLFKDLGTIEGGYLRKLRGMENEGLRKAWIDGDMAALTGGYFTNWRPNGPLYGEEQWNARHVYDPETIRLEPWWHMWGSLDWGYIHPTSIQWHRKAPWGQTFTFKSISQKRVEPFELGWMLARECQPLLAGLKVPAPHINFYVSPDAWSMKESDFPAAMQMAEGINSVLGPRAAFSMTMDEAEKSMRNSAEAYQSMLHRRAEQKEAAVSLVMASNNRISGWMRMQSMMRFKPLQPVSLPDMEYAHKLYEEHGLVSYQQYLNLPEFSAPKEVLPQWQVSKDCFNLIKTIPKAVYKPGTNDVLKWDATETSLGDDEIDCARYGLLSEHLQGEAIEPAQLRIERRAEALILPGTSGFGKQMIMKAAIRKESGETMGPQREFGHNRIAVMRAMRARAGVVTQREPHMRRRVGPPEPTP